LALSWDLLTVHEKNALTQIGVFRGGFRLASAEHVVFLGANAPWIGDVVQSLHEKSWLKVVERASGIRFRMLHLVQRFIEKQVSEDQNRADRKTLRRRHARQYANLSPEGKPNPPRDFDRRMQLADEVDNLGHGLEAAHHHGWVAEAAGLALALADLCRRKGASPSELDRIRAVRAMEGHQPVHLVYLTVEEAVLSVAHGGDTVEAFKQLEQALVLSNSLDDRIAKGLVLREQAILGYHGGEQDVLPHIEEALALHRAEGNLEQQATDLNVLGLVLGRMGRNEASREATEEALELFRQAQHPQGEAQARANLSGVLYRLGDVDGARSHMEEAAVRLQALGMHMAHAKVTGNLVFIDLDRGDLKSARLRTEENLLQNRALRNGRGVVVGLANLAMIYHQQGDLTRAKSLYEEALQGSRRIPLPNTEAITLRGMSKLAHNEGHVEDACEGYEESVARFRDLGNVDGELRALIGLADAHLQTRPDVAVTHLNRAADLVEQVPSAAAHVWLRLGLISAHAGDMSSARGYLASASEGQIDQLAWSRCHLDLLRAEILHCIGDTTDARALLGEIRTKIEHMKLLPTSELVCELTRVGNMTDSTRPR
jgi:tetratricopeptide (TPR) repeat protein